MVLSKKAKKQNKKDKEAINYHRDEFLKLFFSATDLVLTTKDYCSVIMIQNLEIINLQRAMFDNDKQERDSQKKSQIQKD